MSQHVTPVLEDELVNSNSHLMLPSLPTLDIDHLLTTSRQFHRPSLSPAMSSVADDSSIADSVSSVGQEEWEKVTPDDESDIAEPDSISRLPTPSVESSRPLRETVLVFPTPEQATTTQEEDINDEAVEIDREDPSGNGHGDDVLSHWTGIQDFQITFSETSAGEATLLKSKREFAFPLAKISGETARFFLNNTNWKDLDHLAGTVRMAIGKDTLRLARPFKLFYFGDEGLQGALEAKIGSALVAAQHDSELARQRRRYSVLPVSWDKESPQVELMPDSGANMDVETCLAACQSSEHARRDIELVLQSGQSVCSSWRGGRFGSFIITKGYQLPDLAILHLPESEDTISATRNIAWSFLRRHAIPTIVISSDGPWRRLRSGINIDVQSPHLALQVPGQSTTESTVFERLPIDVDTFLRLNSLQLNKNMACMVSSAQSNDAATDNIYEVTKRKAGKIFPFFSKHIVLNQAFLAIGMILMIASALFIHSMPLTTEGSLSSDYPGHTTNNLPEGRIVNSKSVQMMTSSSFNQKSTTPVSSAIATQIPVTKDLMAQVPDIEREPSRLETFEAQLYGDNVVIVRPPKWFAALRRAPEVSFKVIQDGKSIPHNTTHLGEKVYALSIPREHAHGIVDVHISSSKWPKANQTVQVDLGSTWAKLLDWMKAAGELPSASKGLLLGSQIISNASYLLDPGKLFNATTWAQLVNATSPFKSAIADRLDDMRRTWNSTFNESLEQKAVKRKQRQEQFDKSVDDIKAVVAKARKNFEKGVSHWRRTHFREEQKKLLKLWWRLTGDLPAKEKRASKWTPWLWKGDKKERRRKL